MTTQKLIEDKLTLNFTPHFLTVENESGNHNVPPGSETHFKVVMVADAFNPLNRVKRHQLVYQLLEDELNSGVHALALHLYTAEEWPLADKVPTSPQCLGGSASGSAS